MQSPEIKVLKERITTVLPLAALHPKISLYVSLQWTISHQTTLNDFVYISVTELSRKHKWNSPLRTQSDPNAFSWVKLKLSSELLLVCHARISSVPVVLELFFLFLPTLIGREHYPNHPMKNKVIRYIFSLE